MTQMFGHCQKQARGNTWKCLDEEQPLWPQMEITGHC